MSLKSFNAFMAKVNAEETLRNELKQANPDGMTIDSLAAVAAQHGFSFDAQDVSNELSEKDLDLVVGGYSFDPGSTRLGTNELGAVGGSSLLDKVTPTNFKVSPGALVFKFW
jgi:predicted ribosomally synthesized peptide with nif11-like leader